MLTLSVLSAAASGVLECQYVTDSGVSLDFTPLQTHGRFTGVDTTGNVVAMEVRCARSPTRPLTLDALSTYLSISQPLPLRATLLRVSHHSPLTLHHMYTHAYGFHTALDVHADYSARRLLSG